MNWMIFVVVLSGKFWRISLEGERILSYRYFSAIDLVNSKGSRGETKCKGA